MFVNEIDCGESIEPKFRRRDPSYLIANEIVGMLSCAIEIRLGPTVQRMRLADSDSRSLLERHQRARDYFCSLKGLLSYWFLAHLSKSVELKLHHFAIEQGIASI